VVNAVAKNTKAPMKSALCVSTLEIDFIFNNGG